MQLCRLAKGSEEKCPSRCCGRTFRKEIWFSSVCVPFFSNGPKIKPCHTHHSPHAIPPQWLTIWAEFNETCIIHHCTIPCFQSVSLIIASSVSLTWSSSHSPHLTSSTTNCAQNLPEHCYKSHSWSTHPKVVAFVQMNEYLVIRKFDILAMKIVRGVRRMHTCSIDWSDSLSPFSTKQSVSQLDDDAWSTITMFEWGSEAQTET